MRCSHLLLTPFDALQHVSRSYFRHNCSMPMPVIGGFFNCHEKSESPYWARTNKPHIHITHHQTPQIPCFNPTFSHLNRVCLWLSTGFPVVPWPLNIGDPMSSYVLKRPSSSTTSLGVQSWWGWWIGVVRLGVGWYVKNPLFPRSLRCCSNILVPPNADGRWFQSLFLFAVQWAEYCNSVDCT